MIGTDGNISFQASLSAARLRYVSCNFFRVSSQSIFTLFQDGFTVMLIERGPGVETRQIKTSYSTTAGTAYITFDDVRVPVENTLGPEGGGIFVMLSNFNHERWVMCCSAARSQRSVVEECLKRVQAIVESFYIHKLTGYGTQVDFPAQSIRKATELTSCYSLEDCGDDFAHGDCTKLAGKCHVPDVQYVL